MKKYQLLVLLICVVLLSTSVTLLFYSFYEIEYIKHIPMDVTIGDRVGINLDADALHFGMTTRNGCSKRGILIKHEYDYPVKVIINILGKLESWTSIEENDFILNKNEEKEVKFNVCVPSDAVKGKEYTSTARIVFKRL